MREIENKEQSFLLYLHIEDWSFGLLLFYDYCTYI